MATETDEKKVNSLGNFNLFDRPSKQGLFTKIGKTLTATSLGLQGKDPSSVFDEEKESSSTGNLKLLLDIIGGGEGNGVGQTGEISQDSESVIRQAAVGGRSNISGASIDIGGGMKINLKNRQAEVQQAADTERAKLETKLDVPERLSEKQIDQINSDLSTIGTLTDNALLLASNKEEFGKLLGPTGTIAPVRRFMTRFNKEGSEKAFIKNIEQSFQKYRKVITGVQAGFREIEFLRQIFPGVNDTPGAFIDSTYLVNKASLNALERQIPVLKALGKDTSKHDVLREGLQGDIDKIMSVMSPESIQKLDTNLIELMNENGIPIAGQSVVADSIKEAEKLMDTFPVGTRIIVGTKIFEVQE